MTPSKKHFSKPAPPYQPNAPAQYPAVQVQTPAPGFEYPPMQLQEFVLTKGLADRNIKAFPSEKSMQMYKEYRKLARHDPAFARAKKNQNMTYALPLIVSKRALGLGFGDTTFLRFYECLPSPEASDRLYDSVDNRHIGEVYRRAFLGYNRYRLHLKGVETVIFMHTRLPIVDLQIQNERFRFVKSVKSPINPERFEYDIFLLTPDQPSLVDNLDSSLKVNSKNPLLGGAFENLFPFKWKPSDRLKYISPHKCGTFDYHRSWEMFTRTRKSSTFSMYTYAVGMQDANSAVEFRSLILLVTAIILQSFEDDLHAHRTAKNQSIGH